jgi:hypothetical protein
MPVIFLPALSDQRRLRTSLLLVGLVCGGLAGSSTPAAAVEDPWHPAPTVRRITFERVPIFDREDRERLGWLPLGLVNRLHTTTRERVIRREILFASGSPLDPETLDESERKLRQTGFFGDVTILPVFVARDSVDVVVRTREIWTTQVTFGYERFEKQVSWSAIVQESNFLGTARALDLSRKVDEDRATWSVGFSDRQMFDGLWQGGIYLADSDDGPGSAWSLQRPFERVGAAAGGGATYYHSGSRPRYYLSGSRYVRPHSDVTQFGLQYLHRLRLSANYSLRGGLSVRRDYRRFASEHNLIAYDALGSTPQRVAFPDESSEERDVQVVSLILQSEPRHYLKRRFIYAMGTVEDIPSGHRLRFEMGWATRALGASESGLTLSAQHGWTRAHRGGLVTAQTAAGGLWPSGDNVIDLRAVAAVAAYYPLVSDFSLALGVRSAGGSNLDRHGIYTLGIDSGLRAARFREFAGDRLLRANAELRWVYRRGFAGLITPGLVGFFDAGHAWFEDERDLIWKDIRGAIGVGLRLGFARSSQTLPVRVDLGWPVLYDNERPGPILSIGTGQVF